MSYKTPLGRKHIRESKEKWRAEQSAKALPYRLLTGDALEQLRLLPDESVHCVVTSPPYWGLRDYGADGQIGLEETVWLWVDLMTEVFGEVRRVLRGDGTLWLNLGDAYAGSWGAQSRGSDSPGQGEGGSMLSARQIIAHPKSETGTGSMKNTPGLKPKDLMGQPWRVAFALQDDGWYLRSDIVWCLSGGAPLYVRTAKRDAPMMVKDLVRLDPSSVKLWNGEKWTQVLGWSKSHEASAAIELVLRSGERIGCTAGHVWPTTRGNVRADELREGDTIATTLLPEPADAIAPGFMTLEVAWFLGLYLAEGSRSDDMVQLALNVDESLWLPRLRDVATHLGGTLTSASDGNSLNVRMYGKVIVAALEAYLGGHVAKDKHLCSRAWSLPNSFLRMVVTGYLDGDGHDDGARVRLGFTRNYAFERDLRTLAARLGCSIRLKPCIATNQTGEHEAFHGEWRWTRSGHFNEKDAGEVVEIRASRARHFWDIGVEDAPHLFALSSGVLTHNSKPNPMPESVVDRPTKSHEYLFLLSKSPTYFYDNEAIREPYKPESIARREYKDRDTSERIGNHQPGGRGLGRPPNDGTTYAPNAAGRNRRSVWSIPTARFDQAHFATFPEELVEPCVMAGTSEGGCCSACGAPRERVVERGELDREHQAACGADAKGEYHGKATKDFASAKAQDASATKARILAGMRERITTGWAPTCACAADVVPCTVLDCFSGSATTGAVALRLGRRYIGIELNPKYQEEIARPRLEAASAQGLLRFNEEP